MIRDRIVDFLRVPARELRPHPLNWRTHPPEQRAALAGLLDEVGYVDAVLARRLPDGSLMLLDGHLRTDLSSEQADVEIPVLVVDLDEQEAEKVLATFDPVTEMAGVDREKLAALVDSIESSSEAVNRLLEDLIGAPNTAARETLSADLEPLWQVIVDCDSEASQRSLYEELRRAGRPCRLLTLY